jgi:chromosomal replication initiation ATPase DnaA
MMLQPAPAVYPDRHHVASARSALRNPRRRTPDNTRLVIEGTVSQVFGIGVPELELATRGRAPTALARQVAMYLAHVSLGITLTEVGLLFHRDRTTVAHACGVIEDRRDDPVFDRALELLEWAVTALVRPGSLRSFC